MEAPMPALPWTQRQQIDPSREYVAMASRLPLKRGRSIPGFLRDALAIRRQLARSDGLVGYALDAELAHKTFWTFSVWDNRASLHAFASSEPHRAIIRGGPLMRSVTYSMGVSLDGYIAGPGERRVDLELLETRTFSSRVVHLRYRVAR
jgi:heme-degrading monooxygenase HmoA